MIWLAPLLFWAPTLFEQSVVSILQRDFPAAQFILVDVATKEVLGSRWESPDDPIPFGSIVKPFTALAAAGSPALFRCRPSECWLPAGHGSIGLADAIAHSCNSYFLNLARQASPERVQAVSARHGLPSPLKFDPATLAGFGEDWPISPHQIAGAYAVLGTAPEGAVIRQGMRIAARFGTAKLLNSDALAKTGTAPCSHRDKAPGDGYVTILYPAQAPQYVLLIQVHGVSGAVATGTAARMLSVLRHGK